CRRVYGGHFGEHAVGATKEGTKPINGSVGGRRRAIPRVDGNFPSGNQVFNFPDPRPAILVRGRHADGSWITIEGTCKQLQNYGSESLVVLNWRDVTERVAQEQRIRESEEKFRSIFQYSTNAISLVSRTDGRYIDVNDEWL